MREIFTDIDKSSYRTYSKVASLEINPDNQPISQNFGVFIPFTGVINSVITEGPKLFTNRPLNNYYLRLVAKLRSDSSTFPRNTFF